MARRRSPYASSAELEELELTLDDGTRLALLFKDLSPAARLPAARGVRPRFLAEPRRELALYRHVLAAEGLDAPACYAARDDPARGRAWLILERVAGLELYQVGELATWRRVATTLAGMHRRCQPRVQAF